MENSRINRITELQQRPDRIWNVCVIAHVDHGKTSLTDSLLANNHIISRKMTGMLKYLDFREDEQEREITMKSSAVALLTSVPSADPEKPREPALVNLIDSPGHIDFAFEVSSGLQLSDGALVVVDVVEGVAPQTVNLLKRAVETGLKCVLVLNKIDKLITLMNFTPEELYMQFQSIIQAANAAINIFLRSYVQKLIAENPNLKEDQLLEEYNVDEYFSPLKRNVAFCSVIDGWGFRVHDMADQFATKWGMKKDALRPLFWGDYYLNFKEKKVMKKDTTGKLQPMFVQYALGTIYKVYQAVKDKDIEAIKKICNVLDVALKDKDIASLNAKNANDKNALLSSIMHKWMPVDKSLFDLITEQLPNAREGQLSRISNIFHGKSFYSESNEGKFSEKSANELLNQIVEDVKTCNQNGLPVGLTSKYNPLRTDALGHELTGRLSASEKSKTIFVGFTRLLSGQIKQGDELFFYSKKGDGSKVKVHGLFVWMGQNLIPVPSVSAGMIFGFWDPDQKSYKNGCIVPEGGPNILPTFSEQPMIKVRLTTDTLAERENLIEGLRILNRVDTVCEVYNDEMGELVLAVNGEIHLERCLHDLEKSYCNVKVKVSEMLVNFKETVEHKQVTIKKTFKSKDQANEDEKSEEDSSDISESEDEKTDQIDDKKEDNQSEKEKPVSLPNETVDGNEEKISAHEPIQQINDAIKEEKKEPADGLEGEQLEESEEEFDYDADPDEDPEERARKEAEYQAALWKQKNPGKRLKKTDKEESEEDDENKKEYLDDCRYTYKETDFVWKKIKAQSKEISKKNKNLKTKRFDLIKNVKENKNYAVVQTPNQKLQVLVECLALPDTVRQLLYEQEEFVKEVLVNAKPGDSRVNAFFTAFLSTLEAADNPSLTVLVKCHLQSFGPRFSGPNVLINLCLEPDKNLFQRRGFTPKFSEAELKKYKSLVKHMNIQPAFDPLACPFVNSELTNGFNLATLNGPLCEEEVYGCAFIIEGIRACDTDKQEASKEIKDGEESSLSQSQNLESSVNTQTKKAETGDANEPPLNLAAFSFEELQNLQLLRTVKEGFHLSFLGASPRLVQGLYEVSAYCNNLNQSTFCDIIKRKNGRIMDMEYQPEVSLVQVTAKLPVHESFGFYTEVLKGTSGRVIPQLKFTGWEVIEQHPFYEETLTEAELEEMGADVKIRNYAKELVRSVRKRKGLPGDVKIVESGDKQSNISKTR
jgi:small GTP-binding protein